ncbi:ABC transporter permease [Paralimibaculum aggregatum]|uniref:ABC transporter permease n=1 Tax=Paralimibaculum aggregatum TaxID=3036245 RepID=A0ABQ6LSG4_9RHOB|nr:ABC transporter permease [Limibaculum sp. NKW23]GMG85025.1 ABC transporter permease [Limibaculum sp. NKW23]
MAEADPFLKRFGRNRPAAIGAVLLLAVTAGGLLAPMLSAPDPWAMVARPFLWPGSDPRFPLGTDMLGRDLLAGILHGARVSLLVGLIATAAAAFVGISIGALAGYYGGRIDNLLMRLTELFQIVPPFILAVVLVVILEPSVGTIILAIAAISWPQLARLTRAEVLSIREREYVEAAVSVGMSDRRIIFREILPNAAPPLLVSTSLAVATSILLESSLSFLGLGDPNVMSWGTMVGAGREVLRSAWYVCAVPGVAILVTVLAINLVGEGLNDALDPKRRRR